MVVVELEPGGANRPVTEDNKKDYVDAVVEYRINKRTREQSDAFKEGFFELVPQDLITVFDERELELLIGGMSEVGNFHYYSFQDLKLYRLTLLTGLSTLIIVITRRQNRS